jgi:hypothetical protein
LGGGGEAVDDLAFAGGGLDEVDLGCGERGGEGEAGEPRAGADVGDSGGRAQRGGFEAGEAVCDVDVDGVGGIGDGGRWSGLGCEGDQERGQAVYGRGWQLVSGGLGEEALCGPVGQPMVGGEGLDRFA